MEFKCNYCKKLSHEDEWNDRTRKECGDLAKGIGEGYNNMNYYYVCPLCGENNYKKDLVQK